MWDFSVLAPLRFWVGFERELTTLGLYAVGLAVYGMVVGSLNSFISRRDPFETPEPGRGFWRALGRGVRWFFLFPSVGFLYFVFISLSLFFLAKNQTVPQILLVSVSLVTGIRIASWVSEGTAREIAKLVPYGLLGVLIVEPGYLSFGMTTARFAELPSLLPLLGRYLVLLFLLELAAKPVFAMWKWRGSRVPVEESRHVPVKAGANPRMFTKSKRL